MSFLKNLKPIHYIIGGLIIALSAFGYHHLTKPKTDLFETSANVTVYKVEVVKSDDPGDAAESECTPADCFCVTDEGDHITRIRWHYHNCGGYATNLDVHVETWIDGKAGPTGGSNIISINAGENGDGFFQWHTGTGAPIQDVDSVYVSVKKGSTVIGTYELNQSCGPLCK